MTISSILSSPTGINFLLLAAPVTIFTILVHLFPSIENVATAVEKKLNEDSLIMNVLNTIVTLIYICWFIAFSLHGLMMLFILQAWFVCGGWKKLMILFIVISLVSAVIPVRFGGMKHG